MDDGLAFAWAPKTLVYLLTQLAIGLLVVRRLDRQSSGAFAPWQRRLAVALSLSLTLALALRVWVQSAEAFGPAEAARPDNLALIALESRWGAGWRWQAYATTVMVASSLSLRAVPAAWTAFAAGALGLCVAMPLPGHAAGSATAHALHAAHNMAAAAWIGTVGVLTLLAWRRATATADEGPALSSLVRRFSPVALGASTAVAMSGVVLAWMYIGSFGALPTTDYGRTLLFKLAAVSLVVMCGSINWRNVRRGAPPTRLVMTIEWAAAILVMCWTGMLTETEYPGPSTP